MADFSIAADLSWKYGRDVSAISISGDALGESEWEGFEGGGIVDFELDSCSDSTPEEWRSSFPDSFSVSDSDVDSEPAEVAGFFLFL